ncbi:hypothetical protein [Candidatus Uabimicrobium amorphum]|nr:hypothetical protein [Candidatus Uabimicrobium amorphum]
MNGIDAGYYSQLKNNQVALNLSTPGQSFFESLFIVENISKPSRLFLGCSPQTLLYEMNNIPPSNINSLFMYDYQLSHAASSIIKECGGEKTLKSYNRSFFQHNMYSRWIVFSGVNTFFRSLLRKDLKLENAQRNVFYPRPYVKKISSTALRKLQKKYHRERKKFVVNKNRMRFLQQFSGYLKKKNIPLTLVILPEHPYLQKSTSAQFYRDMQSELDKVQRNLNITVYNLYNILDEGMFIDHIHPSQQGAKKLTRSIAKLNKVKDPE